MNPRRNIQRKRRAQRRMAVYNSDPVRPLKRFALVCAKTARAMNKLRRALYALNPPPAFPPGGIIAPAPAGRTGEPILPAHLRS